MTQTPAMIRLKTLTGLTASFLFAATLSLGVEPNAKTFAAGQEFKLSGVIISHVGDILKVRDSDDAIGTVDLTNTTKIQLKKGFFGRKTAMELQSLVPGLMVQAQGHGNENGELVADKVIFDPSSMRASRQIDTRVAPVEARTNTLENRAGTLEGRATTMEGRQGQLENQQQQTQQQVGQVKSEADQANQGVSSVNQRVTNLDNYQEKYKETVYFPLNSAVLSPDDKQTLDKVAQEATAEKATLLRSPVLPIRPVKRRVIRFSANSAPMP